MKKIDITYLAFAFLIIILHLASSPQAMNTDGALLLSFKYSILDDPSSVLQNWNYADETPCLWAGVTCAELGSGSTPDKYRVTTLVLPNKQLRGSVSSSLFSIPHLRRLDLSDNFFNGSLPDTAFNATELQVLSLSNNMISGQLPESINGMISLQHLNLSGNNLDGEIPRKLTAPKNLTVLSLSSNHFSGDIPGGFGPLQVVDLSSNMLNGSLPPDFGGINLRYLNLSNNNISGTIPRGFAEKIRADAIVDLSVNNLRGPIPQSRPLLNQKSDFFLGNADLCGKPLKNLCSIPSSLSSPPYNTTNISPAIAVIPKTETESDPLTETQSQEAKSKLQPSTIVGIIVADLAGLAILAAIALYLYQLKKRRTQEEFSTFNVLKECLEKDDTASAKSKHEMKHSLESNASPATAACNSCIMIKGFYDGTSTSDNASTESDLENQIQNPDNEELHRTGDTHLKQNAKSRLVTVDGEAQLELETLLKASAYILGSSSSSIVYKAVLEDDTAFAVRRIGAESCAVQIFREFERDVRAIAKLRHPNLVRVRGFCWGEDEKLLIYDYVPNGSLAGSSHRKPGGSSSSPSHLPLEVRVKIVKGVARALAFIHEKTHVHGNIKPNNILLNPDWEPVITDLGLDRLISTVQGPSAHFLAGPSPQPAGYAPSPSGSSGPGTFPYRAPESLKSLKPNPKWDVYSFGAVALEVLTGRAFSSFCRELNQWSEASGSAVEDRVRLMRLGDVAMRGEVASNEEAVLACFRLGLRCVSLLPQKRPAMKEAVQLLEKLHVLPSGH